MRMTAVPATTPGETPMPLRRRMSARSRRGGGGLLAKAGAHERHQRLDGGCLVDAFGADANGRAARRGEQQDPHDALAVHLARIARHPHLRLITRREVDELRGGACVHAELVDDDDVTRGHAVERLPFSYARGAPPPLA